MTRVFTPSLTRLVIWSPSLDRGQSDEPLEEFLVEMLAYMKMAKCDDDGPWFAPPLRLHQDDEKRKMKSQFFNESSIETPETSSETLPNMDMDVDGPLCLVVSKGKERFGSPGSNSKQFLPTPPGSPNGTHFPTLHSTLTSPSTDDDSLPTTHFRDENLMKSLLSPSDFMESAIFARALASGAPKRSRGEKKPIPDEQKDGKYFERRKRNNLAAKKSRDARKSREDHIAVRANALEKENAVLRAQLLTLREEADSLQLLLTHKKNR